MNRVAVCPLRSPEQIAPYLPGNYFATEYKTPDGEHGTAIIGRDSCGWTLEDYIIPRLASGLYFAQIVGEFNTDDYPSVSLDVAKDVGTLIRELSA